MTCRVLPENACKELSAEHPDSPAQATTTNQKQRTAPNNYDDGGQNFHNTPEMHNLTGNNTVTDTKDNKNNKANQQETIPTILLPCPIGLVCHQEEGPTRDTEKYSAP